MSKRQLTLPFFCSPSSREQFHHHFQLSRSIFRPLSNLWCGFPPYFSLQMQWHSARSFHYSLFPRTTVHPRGPGLPPLPISIFGLTDSYFTISNRHVGFRTSYCEYQFGCRWEVCSAARQLETNLKMQPEGANALSSPTPAAGQSADCQERQENTSESREEANGHTV